MLSLPQQTDFDAFLDQVESQRLRAVARHWHQARAGRRMPSFAQLRPATIAAQLPIIWVYTFDREARRFTGRLAGDRIAQGYGKNFRGIALEDVHPPHSLAGALAVLTRVVDGPVCYRSGGDLFRKAHVNVAGERIILPLADDGIHGDGVLGASDYQLPHIGPSPVEPIGQDERWFGLG